MRQNKRTDLAVQQMAQCTLTLSDANQFCLFEAYLNCISYIFRIIKSVQLQNRLATFNPFVRFLF